MHVPSTFRLAVGSVRMNWRESLGEYIAGVARVWWALVVGVLAGFLGLVSLVANDDPVKWIPTAIYFPLFGLSVVVAQFLAFHEINNQRHALIESSPRVEVVEKHPQAQFFDNGSPIFLLTQVLSLIHI